MRKLVKYMGLALCMLAGAAGMHLFSWRGLALVVLAESAFAVWMGADLAERERRMAEEIYRAILDEIEAAMEDEDADQ